MNLGPDNMTDGFHRGSFLFSIARNALLLSENILKRELKREKVKRLKNVGFNSDRRVLNHQNTPLGMQSHVISQAITLSIDIY